MTAKNRGKCKECKRNPAITHDGLCRGCLNKFLNRENPPDPTWERPDDRMRPIEDWANKGRRL